MDGEPGWVHNEQGDRSAAVIQVDFGKGVAALAVCAALCGLCAAVSWWAVMDMQVTAKNYRNDRIDLQDEYQRMRNHVIELEAQTKTLKDDLQDLKRDRR